MNNEMSFNLFSGILFGQKKEGNPPACDNMDVIKRCDRGRGKNYWLSQELQTVRGCHVSVLVLQVTI